MANSVITVLVVEDEFLLRFNVVEMMRDGGYEVLEAANADEAIALLELRSDITVLFTDIDIPGSMDGIKLANAARSRWPPIKIVATSGHFQVRAHGLPHGGRFLSKPYNSMQVIGTLREITKA